MTSTVRRRRERNAGAQLTVSSVKAETPLHGMVPLSHGVHLPTSIYPTWKVPRTHAQKLVFWGLLDPVKLTVLAELIVCGPQKLEVDGRCFLFVPKFSIADTRLAKVV